MNPLDFSPILEKEEQSQETVLTWNEKATARHTRSHQDKKAEGKTRILQRLDRITHNRVSFSFQLLKQFILFSSDEETIEIHYKYTLFELEEGVEHLENTYGLHVKLTLVKAFQDICNYSQKRAAYHNEQNLGKLVSACQCSMQKNQVQSCRAVISMFKQMIAELIHDVKETLFEELRSTSKKTSRILDSRPNIARGGWMASENAAGAEEQEPQTSRWRQQVEDVQSYEAEQIDENPRTIHKSMSHQLGVVKYISRNKEEGHNFIKPTWDRNQYKHKQPGTSNDEPAQRTPVRRGQTKGASVTRRRGKQFQDFESIESIPESVQNVIVIRSGREFRKEPDRYIRVPITSNQVKIVELLPQKRTSTKNERENLGISSSAKNGSKSARRNSKNLMELRGLRKGLNEDDSRFENALSFRDNINGYEHHSKECIGCKFCQVIAEMENYRRQRNSVSKNYYFS